MKYLLLLLSLLISVSLNAQDTVKVSLEQGIVDGSVIVPYTNKWNVNLYAGDKMVKKVQFWTDYTQVFEIDGTEYIHRVQDIYRNNELSEIWINVIRRSDLKPVRYSHISTQGALRNIEFEGTDISVSKTDSTGSFVNSHFTAQEEVFDWNLYGMLLAGLPFTKNTVYRIPFWSDKNKMEYLHAELSGEVLVEDLRGNKYEVFEINTDRKLKFWVTKTEPYVIKLELRLGNGKKLVWEKI